MYQNWEKILTLLKNIKYQKRKKRYLKARKELLDEYLAMPQPLSVELVDELECKKQRLMKKYGILQR